MEIDDPSPFGERFGHWFSMDTRELLVRDKSVEGRNTEERGLGRLSEQLSYARGTVDFVAFLQLFAPRSSYYGYSSVVGV